MHLHIEALLVRYGLAAVVLGAALEGDFTLILAGVVAHLGIFELPAAILAGAAGSFAADCVWYALGRVRGAQFRAGRIYRRVGPTVERLAERFGPWQLLAARFVYGTRLVSMVFWGLQGLRFPRFALFDAAGTLLGTAVFVTLGYLVSGSATLLLGTMRRVELWLLGALLAGAVLVFLVHKAAKRELHLEPSDRDA